jgi:hypothetical protein
VIIVSKADGKWYPRATRKLTVSGSVSGSETLSESAEVSHTVPFSASDEWTIATKEFTGSNAVKWKAGTGHFSASSTISSSAILSLSNGVAATMPWSATTDPLWFTKGLGAGGQKVGATIGIIIASVAAVSIIAAIAIILIKKKAPGPELGDNLDEDDGPAERKPVSDQPSNGDDDGSEDYSVSKVDLE